MSRTRTRNMSAPNKCGLVGDGVLYHTIPGIKYASDPTHWPCDYSSYSSMIDNPTPRGVRRDVTNVSHVTYYPSAVNYSNKYEVHYSAGTPTLVPELVGVCPTYYPTSGLPQPDWGELVSKLADQLNGSINSGSQVLVTLKELGSTIAMVRNPFNLLRADWRKICGKLSASALVKGGANIWLEYQYGWKAGLYDVKTFANTFKQVKRIHDEVQQEDSRLSVGKTSSNSWTSPVYPYGMDAQSWNTAYQKLTTGQFVGFCGVRSPSGLTLRTDRLSCHQNMMIANRLSGLKRLLDAFGSDISSIVPTLWEIIPYSFVIDWFIDWHHLTALTQLSRLNSPDVRMLCSSTKILTDSNIEFMVSPQYYAYYSGAPWGYRLPTYNVGSPIATGKSKTCSYTRTAGGPGISSIISGLFQAGLSATRGISGFSLIVQRLLK